MPLGDVIYTQRSIRRYRPEPIPIEDIELIVEAAFKAPNGGNSQIGRLMIVNDPELITKFGAIYKQAWWAKRKEIDGFASPADMNEEELERFKSPMKLADDMANAPAVAFLMSVAPHHAESVLPAAQNLMLAARALGVGTVPTRLHPVVMDAWRELFSVPEDVVLHFTIPMGYPAGNFGPTKRRPTWETTSLNGWNQPVPWKHEVQ